MGNLEAKAHKEFADYYNMAMTWIGEYVSLVESYEVRFPRREDKPLNGEVHVSFSIKISLKNTNNVCLLAEIIVHDGKHILISPYKKIICRFWSDYLDENNIGKEDKVYSPSEFWNLLESYK